MCQAKNCIWGIPNCKVCTDYFNKTGWVVELCVDCLTYPKHLDNLEEFARLLEES